MVSQNELAHVVGFTLMLSALPTGWRFMLGAMVFLVAVYGSLKS